MKHIRKLTEDQVIQARKMSLDGFTIIELSQEFSVSPKTITNMLTGRSYSEIPGAISAQQIAKGHGRGASGNNSRLEESDVIEIRRLLVSGMKLKSIAEQFGVHIMTVSDIGRGKKWSHLGPALNLSNIRNKAKKRDNGPSLTSETVSYIKAHLKEGVSQQWLAKHFKCTPGQISNIYREVRWAHVEPAKNPPPIIFSAEREIPMRIRGERLDEAWRNRIGTVPAMNELARSLEAFAS